MVTTPKGYVEIRSTIPEHLRDAIHSEIIERCGYLRRGLIGEVIREAIQEYADKRDYEKSKISNKKNGLALFNRSGENNKKVNAYINAVGNITMVIPNILEYATKPQDGSNPSIGVGLVEKAIEQKYQITDPRAVINKIKKLVNSGVLIEWNQDEKTGKVVDYYVNMKQIIEERIPILK